MFFIFFYFFGLTFITNSFFKTFDNLFKLGFVPIVNENDTIATTEIKYGDNDRLASRVAQISGADSLILLSDVDGLYTQNPKIYKKAKNSLMDIKEEIEREDKFQELKKIENEFKILKNETKKKIKKI